MKRIVLFWILIFWPVVAQSTVVLEVGLEEMTHASQVIFRGAVAEVVVGERVGRDGAIVTTTTFHVVDVLKGSAHIPSTGKFALVLPGGTFGDRTLRIPGMPVFKEGEEVLLFLEATANGHTICGLQQGVFRVREDSASGVKVVSRHVAGVGMARFEANGQFIVAEGGENLEGYPLEALLKEVRFYVDQETALPPSGKTPPVETGN